MIDVKAIVDLCRLKGLKENGNGWRAATIYSNGKPDKQISLSISSEGMWKCFLSERKGHVIQLYADSIGKPMDLARAELKKLRVIPDDYKTPVQEKSKDDEMDEKLSYWTKNLDKDLIDYPKLVNWRSIPKESFQLATNGGTFSAVENYPDLGQAYAFILTSPKDFKTRAIQYRSCDPEVSGWKATGSYPIWTPLLWDKNAKEVWITEGQWDCMALYSAMEKYLPERCGKIQFVALSGPKNISIHKDVMEYFKDKTVVFIPDNDEKGEKILIETSGQLDGVDCKQMLVRVDKKNGKDFNDWLRNGINPDEFELWVDSIDNFKVSQGVVIDAQFKYDNNLGLNSDIEISPEGDAVEIYTGECPVKMKLKVDEILKITSGFGLFHEFMQESVRVGESPAIFHASSWLTYFAGAIGRRFKFESGSNGCLYLNLYTLCVGPSGIGKGESTMALKPIVAKNCPNIFLSNAFSREGMMDELAEIPQRILYSDEFSAWLKSKEGNYYHQALKGIIEVYDTHHFSEENPWKMSYRNRKGTIEIKDPCLSIISSCTDDQVFSSSETLKSGIIGRFSFPVGFDVIQELDYPGKIKQSTLDKIDRLFKGITGTPIRVNMFMGMDPDATEVYRRALAEQRDLIKRVDKGEDMRTFTSRWRVHVLKYASLFELNRPFHIWPMDKSDVLISAQAMKAAISFVNLLQDCFFLMFEGQFKRNNDTPESKLQNRLMDFLMKNSIQGNGVGRSELYRHLQVGERSMENLISAMEIGGQIFARKVKGRFGRPKTVYLLAKEKDRYVKQITTNGSHHN